MPQAPAPIPVLLLAAAVLAAGCGDAEPTAARGECPADPVKVTVSVDQWSDVVRAVGGDCAAVTTVVESTTADPHEYEPTPADTARIAGADIVVLNGLGYDEWATKAAAAAPSGPKVVDAATSGRSDGDNPHVWYDPAALDKVAGAVTAALTATRPAAADYLRGRATAWAKAERPYRDAVSRTARAVDGATFAATEPVAEYLADALGMTDVTPDGFARATANETEPAPGDVAELLDLVTTGKVAVLLLNSQVEGRLNQQIAAAARRAGVPVVTVTETQPAGTDGFVDWQVRQLDAIAGAVKTSRS